jgi:cobalamin synthase
MNAFQYIFARLYGYTLGRSSRNRPSEACQDAITQFMIVIGVPAICVVFVLMVSVYPQLLASKDWIPWLTIPAAVVFYAVTRSLRRYDQSPEIADRFRSPRSRRITMTLYVITLLLSVLAAGIAARLLRPH